MGNAFPEVRRIGRALGATEVILDAVLVVANGGPEAVDRRLAARSDSTIRRLSRDQPAVAVLVDLLWCNGHPLLDRPWTERRERLEGLGLEGPAWRTPTAHLGDGLALLEAARQQGLDGLLAKRLDSDYRPGARSPAWVEIDLAGDEG
jgi:bifunctional non-homologous end joining protein LigD